MYILKEKMPLKEMATMSTREDPGLIDIDIVIFSNEHFPKHATILKRDNHKIRLGRFIITGTLPKVHQDIEEVKEPIDTKYKKQIVAWAKHESALVDGQTNWKALQTEWNILNPLFK